MKLLRTLGYLMIILVVLYIVLCFAGPKKFEVIKSVNVGASATTVFGEVSDFNKWKDWSPWMKADPNMKPTFAGTPSQIGHMMTWTSESQGSGSQEIIDVLPGQFMKTRLKFTDWDGETNCAIIIEEKGDSTKVSWTMDGSPIAFPLRGLMVVLGAQKSIEEDYTKGLSDLKTIVEAMPKALAIAINYEDMPALTYIGERMQLKMPEATQELFDKTYAELEKTIKPGNRANYPRIAIGHSFNMETQDLDLEIALPINEAQQTMYKQGCTTIPAGKCVTYIHQGSYDKLPEVWGMFMSKVLEKYKPRFAGFEVYSNDPSTVSTEAELLTRLVVPVE